MAFYKKLIINYFVVTIVFLIYLNEECIGQCPQHFSQIFNQFSTDNSSLSSNTIYNIIPGPDGYLWLATDEGLIKYNGTKFIQVEFGKHKESEIIEAYKTSTDILVLLYYNGTTKAVDLKNHQLINTDEKWNIRSVNNNGRPYIFAFEKNGQLHLFKKEFYETSISEWNHIKIKQNKASILLNLTDLETFLEPFQSESGKSIKAKSVLTEWVTQQYLIRNSDSFLILNKQIFAKYGNIKTPIFSFTDSLKHLKISSCTIVGKDLWVGTVGTGLYVCSDYLSSNKKVTKILPYSILSIAQDKIGNIWIGTEDNGLIKYKVWELDILFMSNRNLGVENQSINSGLKLSSGWLSLVNNRNASISIWDNTTQLQYLKTPFAIKFSAQIKDKIYFLGKTILTYDLKSKSFTKYDAFPDSVRPNFIWKDCFLKNGKLHGLSLDYLISIDSFGRIDTIIHNKYRNRLSFQILDSNSYVYGTSSGIFVNDKKLEWLENTRFWKIRVHNNNLYCCTEEGIFYIPTNQLNNPKELRKISSNIGYDIKSFDEVIYFRTKSEIVVFNDRLKKVFKRSFKYFTYHFTINDFLIDKNEITIISNIGVFKYSNKKFLDTQEPTPQIHILNSLNSNQTFDSSFSSYYAPKVNFRFQLDILDYNSEPKRVIYKVLKDGKDFVEWTDLKDNTSFNLNKPNPGIYTIIFNVVPYGQTWKRTISYQLIIKPLWYQTFWSKIFQYLLFIGILSSLVIYISRKISKSKINKLNEELYIKELEAQSLVAQLNPHFIFNALIPFQDFAIRGDNDAALAYVNTFSTLMRSILKNSRQKYILLSEELAFIQNYLNIQIQLCNSCFDFTIQVSENLNAHETHIPTMMLQPLVENAVEHGIRHITYRGKIDIKIALVKNELVITVEDNGEGLKTLDYLKQDNALNIITERLFIIKKLKGAGGLSLSNANQCGTVAILKLPYIKQN